MLSIATVYIIATTAVFTFTVADQFHRSDTYFKAMMTYLADQTCVFVLYNMILSVAILMYRLLTWIFLVHTMEGEIIVTSGLYRKSQIS